MPSGYRIKPGHSLGPATSLELNVFIYKPLT
jgi:hypothetical protein